MPTPPADTAIGNLFGEPELPAGFRYMPEVLSPAEEKGLVQRLEKLPLKPFEFRGYLGNRRIYSFGHRYIFAGQEPRADASIPDYLRPLTDIASRISGTPADAFEQLMVTEYAPGAGIGWHRDRPTFENIVAVSFLAPCILRLRRKVGEDWERRFARIEPRAAYFSAARCVTAGSTASLRWMCCATPSPCGHFAPVTARKISRLLFPCCVDLSIGRLRTR